MRDVEIFARMAKQLPVSVNLSVPTLDEEAWRATEPHTPSPLARLDAVAELRRRGIDSGVLIAPLMPGINDVPEQVQPIVDRAKEAGASFLGGVALHLRDEVKDVFFAWLEEKRPDLLPRYEELYRGRSYMRPEIATKLTRRSSRLGTKPKRAGGRALSTGGYQVAPSGGDLSGERAAVPPPSRASSESPAGLLTHFAHHACGRSVQGFGMCPSSSSQAPGPLTGVFEDLATSIGSGLVVGSFSAGVGAFALSRSRRRAERWRCDRRLRRRRVGSGAAGR